MWDKWRSLGVRWRGMHRPGDVTVTDADTRGVFRESSNMPLETAPSGPDCTCQGTSFYSYLWQKAKKKKKKLHPCKREMTRQTAWFSYLPHCCDKTLDKSSSRRLHVGPVPAQSLSWRGRHSSSGRQPVTFHLQSGSRESWALLLSWLPFKSVQGLTPGNGTTHL